MSVAPAATAPTSAPSAVPAGGTTDPTEGTRAALSQLARVALPPEVRAAVEAAPSVVVPASREELYAL
ncbi:MAG: hypothetical protein J0H73_08580, partial [Salana multivorans]|nr:hypothetical protein [Salana multivorans]